MIRIITTLLIPVLIFSNELIFSEKNIFISSKSYSYDLNRLRVEANWFKDRFTFGATIDNESFLGSKFIDREYKFLKDLKPNLPFNPYYELIDKNSFIDRLYLYRAFLKFETSKSDLTLGLQRIPFGVGRIWTPTDVFNPLNFISIEPSERLGVFGLNYNYYLHELGKIELIATIDKDKKIDKKALRYKRFINVADVGFSFVKSDKLDMFSLEVEGNLGESGAEGRIEAGYFKEDNRDYFSGIIGFDYGFSNTNLIWTMEYLYNSKRGELNFNINEYKPLSKNYIGNILNFEITPLLTSTLSNIINLNDKSHYEALNFDYSLSNEAEVSLTLTNYKGKEGSEFNLYEDMIYLTFSYFF